jgi:Helix-turn-helix domain
MIYFVLAFVFCCFLIFAEMVLVPEWRARRQIAERRAERDARAAFGLRLRSVRERAKLTQDALGKRLNRSNSQSTMYVAAVETGIDRITPSEVSRWMVACGCPEDAQP